MTVNGNKQTKTTTKLNKYEYQLQDVCGTCKMFRKEPYMYGDVGFCELHQTVVNRYGYCNVMPH